MGLAASMARRAAATTFAALGVCGPLTINPLQYSTYEEQYHNFSDEIDVSSSGKPVMAHRYFWRRRR